MLSRLHKLTLGIGCWMVIYAPAVFAADAAHHGEDAAHAADTHHDSGGLPQFDVGSFPSQLFWLFISFAVLYLIFSKKTLPEISGVIENRRQHIESDLETAEKMKTEAEEVHQAYEEALEKARAEASEYFMQAEAEAKEKAAEKLQAFYDSSLQQMKNAEQKIENAKAEAMEEMHIIAAEIASEAAEKIVGIPTNIEQAKTVVNSLKQSKAKAA